ncbi:FAD/NAD(P)-binding domain-containing protein [Eremomyces bilateralis CBS 781.70]|uniref:FAD/NAD(P)-binding domain-containing protein n=1 Tax=Eremomyces bilateralis CBS 781.70 TaxID=1392243 RepID=A0A6G1FR09_9PEZI|nr:FAD/NAD(P)-binding domain-containing protein [Eremomyces bilateralis CBS 781.70]KAF1808150.1 FAD/NAD(P)-binding domain-containing protein [Eremomyces bilateralis CBS 781.70]
MSGFKLIVIGAGLAGSLLSNGLLQNEIDFIVYESDPESAQREGYQIRLGAPAIAGFKACLQEDQLTKLYPMFGRSGGVISSAPALYDEKLNLLLDLPKFPAYTKSAPINRAILRDFLASPVAVAGKIRYGRRFAGYRSVNGASGTKVVVSFDDGSEDECDLLISAEGTSSRVNRQIGLNNIVQLTRQWNFLAKGNLPPSTLLKLGPEIQRAPMSVLCNGMILFISAYLPDGYKDEPRSDKDGNKNLDYDADIASIFWSLSVPADRVPKNGAQGISNKLDFCVDQIRDWDPRYHDMLRSIGEESINVFQARASKEPPKHWRQKVKSPEDPNLGNDHVWLLGDAIHCMLPSRGMGGNQAMCDTADLLPVIKNLAQKAEAGGLSDEDFSIAVTEYESRMFPRAFGWVRTSGGTGDKGPPEMSGISGRILLFFMARALDLAYVYSIAQRLFGYSPPDDAPELPN